MNTIIGAEWQVVRDDNGQYFVEEFNYRIGPFDTEQEALSAGQFMYGGDAQ